MSEGLLGRVKDFLRLLILSVLGACLLFAGLVVWGVRALEAKLGRSLEASLRSGALQESQAAGLESASVSLVQGTVELRGPAFRRAPKLGRDWSASAASLRVELPSALNPAARARRAAVALSKPVLELPLGPWAPEPGEEEESKTGKPAPSRGIRLPPLLGVEFKLSDGKLTLTGAGGAALKFAGISASLRPDGKSLAVELTGRFEAKPPGEIALKASFADAAQPCESEGELRLSGLALPALAGLFPADPQVRIADGRLSLKTQFTCKGGWLTASHLVELDSFRLEVSEDAKEVFGVSRKYAESFFKIDRLSFVVPMNGSLGDPRVGVASSIEQILFKLLEGKYEDKDDAAKVAARGGRYFGKKLDKALTKWAERRKSPAADSR